VVDKLQIEIGLDGTAQAEQQLNRLQQAFANAGVAVSQFTTTLAGVGAAAAITAGAALVRFATAASQVEQSLTQLQDVTGQTFENLSALQQVFAAGGTDAKKFANALGNIAKKAADVAREVELQSIAKAFGPERAKELNEWANDVDALAQQYRFMGEVVLGVGTRITNGLTSVDTMVKAVLTSLAKVSDPERRWARLADILKRMSAGDAARVGEKLGLSPEQISTLRQGSAILQGLQDEAKILGTTLTTANQQALQQMAVAWNQFGRLTKAVFDKIGAAAAPAFTGIIAAANAAIIGIVQDFRNMPLGDALANLGNRLGPMFQQIFATLSPIIVQGGQALGEALVGAFASAVAGAANTIISNFTTEVMTNLGILAENVRRLLNKLGGNFAPASAGGGGGPGGFAGGGLLGGRGTGTSDSNLAWVSRGEHIMPAAAVAQPGVLSFLEALRRSGGNLRGVLNDMGRFALGGMVPRARLAYANGGPVGGSNVTIQFPGLPPIGGLRASAAVVEELRHAATLAQVRSGGRKPSRYS